MKIIKKNDVIWFEHNLTGSVRVFVFIKSKRPKGQLENLFIQKKHLTFTFTANYFGVKKK
jgi:hypothetical protein